MKKIDVNELYEAYKKATRDVKAAEEVKEALKKQLFTLVPENEALGTCKHYKEEYKFVREKDLRNEIVNRLVPKTKMPEVLSLTEHFTEIKTREGLRDA